MSQYYVAQPKQLAISRDLRQEQDQGSIQTLESSSYHLGDSAVYIFPNPSESSAPPSPSQSSDLSIPTDFTLSAIELESDINSPRPPRSRLSSYASSSPLSESSDISTPWEWTPEIRSASVNTQLPLKVALAGLDEAIGDRSNQWVTSVCRRDTEMANILSTSTQESQPFSSLIFTTILRRKSNERIHSDFPDRTSRLSQQLTIPLLSFFISLLSIDQTTVDLLTLPSSHSVLFPGSNSLVQIDLCRDDDGNEKALHGVRKLLASQDLQSPQRLRDGLNAAVEFANDASPSFFIASTSQFSGIWKFMGGFVTNSGKALRDVFHPSPDD